VQAPRASVEPLVDTYRRGWDALRGERFARMVASGLATEEWVLTPRSLVPVDGERVTNGYSGRPNPAWEELPAARREDLARRMAIFAAMLRHVDDGLGRLVADLRAHEELADTLILLLSDNGACYEWGPFGFDGPSRTGVTTLHEGDALDAMGGPGTYHAYGSGWANLGNTPFRLYKHYTHAGGLRVPLVAHWPAGIDAPDRWVRDPVHVMDLMPTLCELAGAEYPGAPVQPSEGQSLVPTFRGEPLPERTLAFEHQAARALRAGSWKAVWGKRMPTEPAWELYDLAADPCETRDLAGDEPERVRALADEWLAWARRVGVHPFAAADAEQR
jgi:arylsulfatase